jgi:hypothetical protein
MPSFSKRHEAKKKKDAIGILKSFAEKIKSGQVDVETCNWWEALPGKYNLKLVVKESENSPNLDVIP